MCQCPLKVFLSPVVRVFAVDCFIGHLHICNGHIKNLFSFLLLANSSDCRVLQLLDCVMGVWCCIILSDINKTEDTAVGNYMKAYTIAFEQGRGEVVSSRSIVSFFEKIETILLNSPENVIRRINGKVMRVHAYEWNRMNHDYLVVPIGKLKERNRPYGSDPATQRLIDIPQEMFDVNSIAYHKRYDVALISTNQYGPNENDIENYLNSYLLSDAQYKIHLTPIMRNIALEKIRNAHQAKSITIALDLGRPINDFLDNQVYQERNAYQHLRGLMEYSKNTLESNTFSLTLGLGRRRNATLDIGALVELLDSINLDANCIKEIAVNYRSGPDEKIDIAKLRNENAILRIQFPINGTQLGAEYILNNMDEILRTERPKYYQQVHDHFSVAADIGEVYEIREIWDERPIV